MQLSIKFVKDREQILNVENCKCSSRVYVVYFLFFLYIANQCGFVIHIQIICNMILLKATKYAARISFISLFKLAVKREVIVN